MKTFKLSENNFLLIIFLFSLIVRAAYAVHLSPQQLSQDSYGWMATASDLLAGHGFGDAWKPPAFPVYLSIVMFFFGKSILVLRLFNCLLGSLTCVLAYFIGKKIFPEGVGGIAAVLVSFYPYFIAYAGDLLSETFFTFMIALSALLILACSEKPVFINTAMAGIVMGLTSLTKSTILPFFLFSCLWIWWQTKSFMKGFIVGLFMVLAIMPWTIRNYANYHAFIPITTMWQSAYLSCNDGAMYYETAGERDAPQIIEDSLPITPGDYTEILKLPRMEQERVFKQKSLAWLRSNPASFKKMVWLRLFHFWRLYPMMAYKWQKIVALFTSGLYIILCWIGAALSLKYFKKTILFLGLFAIFTLVHLFFFVSVRYRVPIDPYIIIFASFTIYAILAKVNSFIHKLEPLRS